MENSTLKETVSAQIGTAVEFDPLRRRVWSGNDNPLARSDWISLYFLFVDDLHPLSGEFEIMHTRPAYHPRYLSRMVA